jgi:hypothetical protein
MLHYHSPCTRSTLHTRLARHQMVHQQQHQYDSHQHRSAAKASTQGQRISLAAPWVTLSSCTRWSWLRPEPCHSDSVTVTLLPPSKADLGCQCCGPRVSVHQWQRCRGPQGCPGAQWRSQHHQRWARPCRPVPKHKGCQQQLLCHQHAAGQASTAQRSTGQKGMHITAWPAQHGGNLAAGHT